MTSLHFQTSLHNNVMHIAHLIKQVSVDYVSMTKVLLIATDHLLHHKTSCLIKLCQIVDKYLPCI